MIIRVAINGYGRIGRNILRAYYEGGKKHDLQFVAINDLGNAQTNAHLTRYDTTHGKFPGTIAVEGESMVVNGDRIQVCAKRNPAELPWKDLKVDAVLECTGLFTSKEKASSHLAAGAKKVVISAPGEKDVDRTIVVGVNDKTLKASDTVISNGSCTTNESVTGSAARASSTKFTSRPTSGRRPSPVTAEMRPPSHGSVPTSALVPTVRRGRSRSSGLYRRNSSSSTCSCSAGATSSTLARSTSTSRARARSTCRRN